MGDVMIYNDKVYTSCYSRVGNYMTKARQVSISVSSPSTFKGSYYKELAPTVELLRAYKSGEVTEEEYEITYRKETLDKLDINEVYQAIKGKAICCWEKKGGFCHRHIVMKWLVEQLGEGVEGKEI